MTTIVWPRNIWPGSADYGIEFDIQLTAMRSGRVYTHGLPGARWVATIGFDNDHEEEQRPRVEAMIVRLRGGANQLEMPHFGRPVPRGTMRGSPTLVFAVAPGVNSIVIAGTGTLKAGDIVGINGQLVMIEEDAVSSGGALTVKVSPAIRKSSGAGTAVVWNRPTCLWMPKNSTAGPFPYRPKMRPGFSVELVEAF